MFSKRESVVQLENVSYTYREGDSSKQVLFDTDFTLNSGEVVILQGPSGCGKTTMLTLIGGLRSMQTGQAWVYGQALHECTAGELAKLRRRIGFVFQMHNLLEYLTARQNVQMSLQLLEGITRSQAESLAGEMLVKVGLDGRLDAYPKNLSGGQKQRVSIARALAHNPRLILADEPTSALDSHVGREIVNLLHDLARKQGCAVLIVTHDNRILDIADRIVTMEDGRIISLEKDWERLSDGHSVLAR
jgi:putative ABC transport system ATP-binding protein